MRVTGVAAGSASSARRVWLYAFAGILDVLDGRLARLAGKQTAAGALFDSVSDRWGELFVFAGYAWYLHDSPWLLAVMGAIGGSMMVSYTRARAEGLGVALSGGMMQRAERIVLVAGGTLIAAWYGADADGARAILGHDAAARRSTRPRSTAGSSPTAMRSAHRRSTAAVGSPCRTPDRTISTESSSRVERRRPRSTPSPATRAHARRDQSITAITGA